MSGQRVDAVRNRRRVLEAAFDEHARHGAALGMQDVARRAGVGIGTVYRHFPSREALIEAIAHPFFERGLLLAQSVREEVAEEDRFAAFARGFARVLADHGVEGHCTWDAPAAEPVRAELRTLITGFVAALVEAADEPIWQRHLDLVLDSLRGKPPRNLLAPAIDRAQWDRFVRSTRDSWAE